MADTEPLSTETATHFAVKKEDEYVDMVANAHKYFSRTNHINKGILFEERYLKKHIEDQWESLPPERRDDLLDLVFVDEEVRKKYDDQGIYGGITDVRQGNSVEIEESFPRLLLNMGQKINVDFENELWTWRDEHSGPFSWMSRSQQDLTLADLEADTILKPQPKQPRVDLDDETLIKKAKLQFTYPCNSWSHDLVEDFKKHQKDINLTPSPSLDFATVTRNVAEECNLAFENSADDLPSQSTQKDNQTDQSDSYEQTDRKSASKDRGRKSPSPQKIVIRSGSLKKSPIKKSDKVRDEKLISHEDDSFSAEAYSNPVMESEWSSFVGDTPAPTITTAPGDQVIDRVGGGEMSPYRGDLARLIPESSDSPVAPPKQERIETDYREWSVESTPDHNTHLLKGMQANMASVSGQAVKPISTGISSSGHEMLDYEDVEEEIISVYPDNSDIKLSSQSQDTEKRVSDIPSTGFDFLDNW